MIKSKEALEKLYEEREYLLGEKVNHKTKNWHNDIKHYDNINKCLLTIKQDLDRLEKLEKIFSDSHICEIKARFDEIECSADKCENCPLGIGDGICLKKAFERKWELQKENQELIKKADCCLWQDCNKISQENTKLKNAIELLKDKFELELINEELHFNTYECDTREMHELYDELFYNLTKEETEILKEVLEE